MGNTTVAATRKPERVIAYIDGFNLYFGLKVSGWRRYYWLDLARMAARLLLPSQTLAQVKYFTSLVSATPSNPQKPHRQSTYLDAIRTSGVQLFFGHYLQNEVRCRNCGAVWRVYDEKMTDVNIATELLSDAFDNRFDVALVVSADSDLVGPIQAVRARFAQRRIVVAFPPQRASKLLRKVANASFTIGRGVLASSQFPDAVTKSDGFVLHRPTEWK